MTIDRQPLPDCGYRTRFDTVRGGGADLHLRSLLDRNQYHDPDGEAERAGIPAAAWPLFGMLWPSGQVLAGIMASFEIAGKRILEVGCGLALASLVIHRRGGDITASDCHPLCELFLQENLRLNLLPALAYQSANWSGLNPLLGRFDLIIGSDVLYDRAQPEMLTRFIDLHAEPQAEILIVDPNRGNQASFSRRMGLLGYAHSKRLVAELPGGGPYKGQVHRYARSAAPVAV